MVVIVFVAAMITPIAQIYRGTLSPLSSRSKRFYIQQFYSYKGSVEIKAWSNRESSSEFITISGILSLFILLQYAQYYCNAQASIVNRKEN